MTVYDGGLTRAGAPFLAMEYLAGGSLAYRARMRGPLPVATVLDIGVKLAGALETAHRAGVLHRELHRDIKPENILVSQFGAPMLADFGISRINGAAQTESGVITATLAHARLTTDKARVSSHSEAR